MWLLLKSVDARGLSLPSRLTLAVIALALVCSSSTVRLSTRFGTSRPACSSVASISIPLPCFVPTTSSLPSSFRIRQLVFDHFAASRSALELPSDPPPQHSSVGSFNSTTTLQHRRTFDQKSGQACSVSTGTIRQVRFHCGCIRSLPHFPLLLHFLGAISDTRNRQRVSSHLDPHPRSFPFSSRFTTY